MTRAATVLLALALAFLAGAFAQANWPDPEDC